MRSFSVKHVKIDARNGHYVYRRRVPKGLKGLVMKTEFIKTVGHTEAEALANYGNYHQRVEHMIALGRGGVAGLSPREEQDRLKALLLEWDADPHGPGRDDNERTWRGEAADKLVAPYQDPRTGEYEGVPERDAAIAGALTVGVPKEAPQPTITDAFRFYLEEKDHPQPEKHKKLVQRLRRAERRLIEAVGGDKQVAELTRQDARTWRDRRLKTGVAVTTVKREKNDLSAVIGLAQKELDAGGDNPFRELGMPKVTNSRQAEREALPPEVISGVYEALDKSHRDLLQIWTLLDFTGARPSEIRQLLAGEVVLDHAHPHAIIHERADRSLKTSWSTRTVPLVGEALKVVQRLVKGVNDPKAQLFPRFYGDGGMDDLSKALNRRVRKLTKNPKHVTYSLRHNMKDRLRAAEIYPDTQQAIQGHAYAGGEAAYYGGPVSLQRKQEALEKALRGYRGTGGDGEA
ncbi:integrase [Roseovarius sp. MBR-78]